MSCLFFSGVHEVAAFSFTDFDCLNGIKQIYLILRT